MTLQTELDRNLTLARELTTALRETREERDQLRTANEHLARTNAGLLERISALEAAKPSLWRRLLGS